MKKLRLHIWILLGAFLVLLIIGSFADLSLSKAIFSRNNGFGIFMSMIGTIPGYGMLAFLAGGLFTLAVKRDYSIMGIIFLYMLGTLCFLCSIYFSGREFFGPNGLNNPSLSFVGYIIALPFMLGFMYLGYFVSKDSDNKYLLIVYLVLVAAIGLALLAGTTFLKSLFHRPRYRTLSIEEYSDIVFASWWQRTPNYKDLMNQYSVISEEFKSFPSGHASASMVFVLVSAFIPLFNKKYAKLQLPIMYGGLAFGVLVMFTRILVGAHFLSDVSMGAIITLLMLYISNEIFIYMDKKHPSVGVL